jgi:predicted permease
MIMNALSEVDFSVDNLLRGFTVTGIGFGVMAVSALIAFFAVSFFKDFDEKKIGQFGLIFANAGFMGIPVLKATFGDIGAFYGAFFQITFHLTLWTYGMFILSRKRDDIKFKPFNMFVNFGTVPVLIGVILYIIPFQLPAPVTMTMNMLSSVCAPGSMVIVGSILASIPIKSLLTDIKVYYLALIKLIVLPAVICCLFVLFGMSEEFVYLFTLLAALPTATNTAMYAQKYEIAPQSGAKIASFTTVFSMATVPLMKYFAGLILSLRS